MIWFRLVGFALTATAFTSGAEPNWPQVEQHAVELLQQCIRIPSINPPADTTQTAKLLHSELAAAGIQATLRSPFRSRAPSLGKNTLNAVPVMEPTARLRTRMFPPCWVTIPEETHSPSPVPFAA